jgi:hypothetical protein
VDTIISHVPTALAVLGAVIALLAVISPLTKSDIDNRALDQLRKVADFLGRLIGSAGPKVK